MKKSGNVPLDLHDSNVTPLPQEYNKSLGVQCLLHTLCNLRCKFCFETKKAGVKEVDDKINPDFIRNLPYEITKTMAPIVKKHDINNIATYTMGGELFSDNIPDNIFDVYGEFARNLEVSIKKEMPDVKHYGYFFTNGMFKNRERVEKFFTEFSPRVIMSYDPVDRFTVQALKDLWYENFKHFNTPRFDVVITTVLTKRNINAYIAGDETFEKVGNEVFIDSHDYSPRIDYHEYLPNDEDLFNFYRWALDNGKFNISHINDIFTHTPICNRGFFYIFGEGFDALGERSYIHDCTEEFPLDKEYYFGENSEEIIGKTNCTTTYQLGLQKRGCLLCEYYDVCPKMCWKQIIFDKYEVSICPLQKAYTYIEENPQITTNYEKWREYHERNCHSL